MFRYLKLTILIHKFLMLLALMVSIIAFVVVLSYREWCWVNFHVRLNFAHSIVGVIAFSFSFIQVIFCLIIIKDKRNIYYSNF